MNLRRLGLLVAMVVGVGGLSWLGVPGRSHRRTGDLAEPGVPRAISLIPSLSPAIVATNDARPSDPVARQPSPPQPLVGIPLLSPADELWQQRPKELAFAQFHDWAEQYQAAASLDRPKLVSKGVELATQRRAELKELIEVAPERALELTVPLAVRRGLPDAITAQLEERISARGDFEVLAALPQVNATSESLASFRPLQRRILTGDRRLEASVYGLRLGEPTQIGIGLHGVALDGKMALSESPYRRLEAIERTEALASLAATGAPDPICSISAQPAASLGTAVAVDDGENVVWYCHTEHARVGAQKARATGGAISNFELLPDGNLKPLSARTEGQKRILLIRVDFPDETGTPLTDTQATNLVNGLNRFYRESSYGKAGFRALGDVSLVTATLRMTQTSKAYGLLDPSVLRTDARNAAKAAGVNLNTYDYDLLCFKNVPGFNFGGLGFVGAPGAWIQNAFGSPGVSAHELGHNFGLNHANFWDTGGQSILGAGNSIEYGDGFDTMGNATAGVRHFNARYKALLDWLPANSVRTLTTNGTYRLFPMDVTNANTEIRALKIARNSQTNYWFEFRQIFTSSPASMNGLGIRWARSGNQSALLLDTTPGSADGAKDAPLVIGRTFSDPMIGLHVTPIGFGGTTPQSLDVVVNRGTFTNNSRPTVSVTAMTNASVNAALQFTATATDAEGDPLAYGWDFGDGTFGKNLGIVSHAFSTAGEYVVRCEVSDMKGGLSSDYVVVRVGAPSTLRISGQVTRDGLPVDGIRVSTSNTKQTFTGADGTYVLTGLAKGTYGLTAHGDGLLFTRTGFNNPLTLNASKTGADFLAADPGDLQNITLVPIGAEWHFWDKGTLPASDWNGSSFDDTTWRKGAAQLGYGDSDVVTVVDFGSDSANKYITTWFRSAFMVDDPTEFLTTTVGLIRDHGAVVYLNGKEIFRSNMPAGTIVPSTRASATVSGTDESTIYEYDLAPMKLLSGRNVLAVEVHQSAPDSSDVSFSLQLIGLLQPKPVSPTLKLKVGDGVIRLSWPVTATGYSLFSSSAIGGTWEPVGETVLATSGDNVAVISPDETTRLFRLQKP